MTSHLIFCDVQDMPDYHPSVKDRAGHVDCVTKGEVKLIPSPDANGDMSWPGGVLHPYPVCVLHGAMARMTREGIYRCIGVYSTAGGKFVDTTCGVGCYYGEASA